ncbi:hypothetical protein OnM2_086064 [Erysiphe neolycopersici]|uniref:Uncharacterized protein n=1 Tax=Erysiphe neolycopersici TaxID=212602 RepID=A0A420HEL8_9PEZI|nr:hypothetical protein OnM2_086064 [Erysiphe neolycopersici]
MAQDTEKCAAREEKARKEVSFGIIDLEQRIDLGPSPDIHN